MNLAHRADSTTAHHDVLSADEVIEEALWTGLRLDQGVEVTEAMRNRFGVKAKMLCQDGLLVETRGHWRVTARSRPLLHSILQLVG